MEIKELAELYQRASKVQDAAARDLLSNAVAQLAAVQSTMDAQAVRPAAQGSREAELSEALVAKARKEVVESARAVASAVDKPGDTHAAHAAAADAMAAEAIAAEAVAAEAAAAEPLAAEPFMAEPMAAEPFAAEPMAAEPFAAEPMAAEPMAAEPFAAEPMAAEPFVAEPLAAEPLNPAVARQPALSSALQAFVDANKGGSTGR